MSDVKGIIRMHRFNICLGVVLSLSCSGVQRFHLSWQPREYLIYGVQHITVHITYFNTVVLRMSGTFLFLVSSWCHFKRQENVNVCLRW